MYCFYKAKDEKTHCHDYEPNYGKSARKEKTGGTVKMSLYAEYLCNINKKCVKL